MWVVTDQNDVHTNLNWWDQLRVGVGEDLGLVFVTLKDGTRQVIANFKGNEALADILWEELNVAIAENVKQFNVPGWIIYRDQQGLQ